jgi:riboflavin biosynthesis pyrimidine reductase
VADELFLTLAPTLLAGDGLPIVAGPLFPPELRPRLELISLFEHQDELFLRYQVRPPRAPAAPPGGG